MDNAVLVPSVGNRDQFIAGIRQGRFYKCDPNTGAIITSAQVYGPTLQRGSITYLPVNDTLYFTVLSDLTTNSGMANPQNIQNDVYPINPTTLAVGTGLGIGNIVSLHFMEGEPAGPSNIIALPNGQLAMIVYSKAEQVFIFFIDPINPLTNGLRVITTVITDAYYSADWDTSTNRVFYTDPGDGQLNSWDLAVGHSVFPRATPPFMFGLAVCPDNNSVYITTATDTVIVFAIGPNTFSTFSLGRPNAKPIAIRYNSHNHRIYVPTWTDNTVCIVDPNAGNAVTVRTGFDCPADAVFTASKSFAVQQGTTGLLAIP